MATSSFVHVDYPKLDKLIEERGTSRAKCATACGILSGTLGNSFKRKSKMKAATVRKIAEFLGVSPLELLIHDSDGNVDPFEWDAVTDRNGIASSDKDLEKSYISEFADLCDDLNWRGIEKVYTVARITADVVRQIPKYRKDNGEKLP